MYVTKTAVGRGYTVAYPFFEGEGCGTVNRFYETLRDSAAEYFESLIRENKHTVCRTAFSVKDSEDVFTVTFTIILRQGGRRYGEKALVHRWRRWEGRDTVLDKRKYKEMKL